MRIKIEVEITTPYIEVDDPNITAAPSEWRKLYPISIC